VLWTAGPAPSGKAYGAVESNQDQNNWSILELSPKYPQNASVVLSLETTVFPGYQSMPGVFFSSNGSTLYLLGAFGIVEIDAINWKVRKTTPLKRVLQYASFDVSSGMLYGIYDNVYGEYFFWGD